MSRCSRSVYIAVLSTAAAAVGVVVALTAGPVAASAASRPGYTLERSGLIGETPAGFSVYVDVHAAEHAKIAQATTGIATELRRFGLAVRYAGYGNPAPSDGRIEVNEGSSGCSAASEGRTLAVTVPYYAAAAGSDVYMSHSTITVCPSFGRSASRTALTSALKHEFGHAMGLGHTSYSYAGHHQIMYPGLQSTVTDYQAGDVRGLKTLAAGAARVKNELPPIGKQYSQFVNGTIVFSGWSLLTLYPTRPVTVTLTDNGHTVYRSASSISWANVNTTYHVSGQHGFTVTRPWTGGTHNYCISATSSINTRAVTNLGCVTWYD